MGNKESGARIREVRNRRGMAQEDLAEAMGMERKAGQQRIHRWETGETNIQRKDLEKLSKALDVPEFLLVPDSGVEWVVRWFEAAVRQVGGLPEEGLEVIEVLEQLTSRLGPLPEATDEEGWSLYLQQIRAMLLQTQRGMIGKIGPRSGDKAPPGNGQRDGSR